MSSPKSVRYSLGGASVMTEKVESNVTAAYTTITSRLGVVVTRLLAAAFWLGVGRIADIAVVRRTGDST